MTVIVGLDIGRAGAVAAALDHFPKNPRRYFSEHRREFLRLGTSHDGVDKLLAMRPDGLIMEPTGMWYASFWRELAAHHGISVYWVGHADLAAQRKAYGFSNKRDDEDAFCLAMTYFDDRFIDVDEQKRYLFFETGIIQEVRDLFFELEQLDKASTALKSQIRLRLSKEFPEICERHCRINPKLGFSSLWGWLAGIHTYPRIEREYERSVARSIGIQISQYTRDHAASIVELELRQFKLECRLSELIQRREFAAYLKVFRKFGFGLRNQALLLFLVYPFEKFLKDGKPWVEWEESASGKKQKRHRSLRSFQAYLGLSYTLKESGDKKQKKFGGSDIARAHLYMWAVDAICTSGNRRLDTSIGKELGKKYDELRKWRDEGGKRVAGSDAVPGRDAIIRILFRATALLFKELCKELL